MMLKATGAGQLPFQYLQVNAAWFELALLAHAILVWTQPLTLDGEPAISEPKRLLYRILCTSQSRSTAMPGAPPAPTRQLALGRSHPARSSASTRSPPTADRPGRTHHPSITGWSPLSKLPKTRARRPQPARNPHRAPAPAPRLPLRSRPHPKPRAPHLDDESRLGCVVLRRGGYWPAWLWSSRDFRPWNCAVCEGLYNRLRMSNVMAGAAYPDPGGKAFSAA
jgi:hypothetical protein